MDIVAANGAYEKWLGARTKLMVGDLRIKHAAMGADAFSFFRATYFRWAQRFGELCPKVNGAPKVLAVGDLHIENYGTWRDALGRLAWGINDFDEAYELPVTHDLVRLATSVHLVLESGRVGVSAKEACGAILEGYRAGLSGGGRPFVIGDEHRWFRPLLHAPEREPGEFWDKLRKLPAYAGAVPAGARAAIAGMMPDAKLKYLLAHRVAGLGNLGKPRLTAVADWRGGPVAREAKWVSLSAAAWAAGKTDGPYYARILGGCVRSADPFLRVDGDWIVRRLAPDCRRIELDGIGRVKDQEYLLHAMGAEAANVHVGTGRARGAVVGYLKSRGKGWLHEAVGTMRDATMADWGSWRKGR